MSKINVEAGWNVVIPESNGYLTGDIVNGSLCEYKNHKYYYNSNNYVSANEQYWVKCNSAGELLNILIEPSNIQQLKDDYAQKWAAVGQPYVISELYNIWYERSENNILKCRAYYKYTGYADGYWNANIDFDLSTNLWSYNLGSGNYASITDNGLPNGVYTLIYSNPEGNTESQ